MKAVLSNHQRPVTDELSFVDCEVPTPTPTGRDILVVVKAVSVNPVDLKVRRIKAEKGAPSDVLGWDASGVVEAIGPDVTLFRPGDEVYYAGDITRSGSNVEYQLVDERIAGFKPKSISFAAAAALPLTSITAFGILFDRIGIDSGGPNPGQSVLMIGAAGGVGSVAVQLAKRAGLTVIATASRPETEDWIRNLGADYVVNHHGSIADQVRGLGFQFLDYAIILNDMRHWGAAVELIRPNGAIGAIEFTNMPMPMEGMKDKAASLHWENVFTRVTFQTQDMIAHHNILNHIGAQIDSGAMVSTLRTVLSPICAENVRRAHMLMDSGSAIGKIVISTD